VAARRHDCLAQIADVRRDAFDPLRKLKLLTLLEFRGYRIAASDRTRELDAPQIPSLPRWHGRLASAAP
jgi:hypothetical protein